ncbi:MAG: hypothetical protein JO166_14640 [Deltaproteobacteria bacterium]|nr:hypothetical protein [Deltaproteobacteria bacterium]
MGLYNLNNIAAAPDGESLRQRVLVLAWREDAKVLDVGEDCIMMLKKASLALATLSLSAFMFIGCGGRQVKETSTTTVVPVPTAPQQTVQQQPPESTTTTTWNKNGTIQQQSSTVPPANNDNVAPSQVTTTTTAK